MSTATAGIHGRLDELARLNANADPEREGITREVFTPLYAEAVGLVGGWMREAGLEVREDAFGNLLGRWEGADPSAPAVLTGSHFDTTLNAGAFDGTVGVLGAIAAVARLREEGFVPARSVEVVGFAGEEPRFGTGCIGSRAMVGTLTRADLDALEDRAGVALAAALRDAGLDPDRLGEARLDPAGVHAFVELHIEQGAVLESEGVPIGVVTAIAAPHDVRVTLRGAATHAGATPMGLRRDALVGAAEAIVALEAAATASPSGTTVGTVGVARVAPGAINVVPGEVSLDVDVRDSEATAREAVLAGWLDRVREIAERRALEVDVEEIVRDEPVACAPDVVAAARGACEELGLAHREMISGAYHDAMILGAQVPIGMLFVPSRDGVSHHPSEHTAPEDVERGVEVLAATLRRLAS